MFTEKRKYSNARLKVQLPIQVFTLENQNIEKNTKLEFNSINVSMFGLLLHGKSCIAMGTLLQFNFKLPQNNSSITCIGSVVRSNEASIGGYTLAVKLLEMNPSSALAWQHYIKSLQQLSLDFSQDNMALSMFKQRQSLGKNRKHISTVFQNKKQCDQFLQDKLKGNIFCLPISDLKIPGDEVILHLSNHSQTIDILCQVLSGKQASFNPIWAFNYLNLQAQITPDELQHKLDYIKASF